MTRSIYRTTMLTFALSLVLSACGDEGDIDGYEDVQDGDVVPRTPLSEDANDVDDVEQDDPTPPEYAWNESDILVTDARILGAMDHFVVDNPVSSTFATAGLHYTTVYSYIDETSTGDAVMTVVDFVFGFEHDDLEVGARRTYYISDYPGGIQHNAAYVMVVGCAGPEVDDWEFDKYADVVEVEVLAGPTPNARRIRYGARFPGVNGGASSTVSGEFTLTR